MPRRLTITFPVDRDNDYYFRVFWFAESLHGSIIQSGLGTMNDVDKAREAFWIQLSDSHDLGKVKKIVRQALAKFSLTGDAIINTG